MLKTRICDLLSIDHAVISAPMGPDLSGPELVSAVSDAGGLGILQAQLDPPELLRAKIAFIRERTSRPFGVNFILHFPSSEGVALCLDEQVPVLSFSWGAPGPSFPENQISGIMVP